MSDVNSPQFWQTIYWQGQTGWDLGGPTPVFERLLRDGQLSPGRMIVLGAGLGHDAFLFARHGFQVTAVDFAPAAVQAMRDRSSPDLPLAVIQADIFNLPDLLNGHFDYVLEYTFFCAIQPQRRAEYATVVGRLLQPGGAYVALVFPIGEGQEGPPFPVSSGQLIRLLQEEGLQVEHRETPPDSVSPRRGREELLIMRKQG